MIRHPALPYVAPFAAFILFLALDRHLPGGIEVAYPIRAAVVTALLFLCSGSVLDWRLRSRLRSVALGVVVFVIWVGPDVLWPDYRQHWLFKNWLVGEVRNPLSESARSNWLFLAIRAYGCALMVPVMEELFWRGWLARWLIEGRDFQRVPLGAYTTASYFIGSVLFGMEHGPYWEVGIITGVLFNWWMARTKSLADCIVTHGVANACLSAYVLAGKQWQYW